MVNTKAEILGLLKRNGGHSVRELAEMLGLASITVRQHMTHLERDGLVATETRAHSNGRAPQVFHLTPRGHAEAFPRRSDRVAELLVREIGQLEPRDLEGRSERQRMLLVLQRLAQRVADEYAPLLRGWPLRERVSFVTSVMHADSGLAEWEGTERGFEIRDFNCMFHRLLGEGGNDACEWHRSFLTGMLGADVRVSPRPDEQGRCCRYLIEAAAPVAT